MSKINKLSEHRPKLKFPSNKNFGYYLAGLIDGDGSIDKNFNKITIAFNSRDIDFAFKLRTYIGYGKVSYRPSVTYVITHPKGLKKIIELIYGKLQIKRKINSLDNLMKRLNYENNIKINNELDILNTSYLAGLIDADGSLRIRIIERLRNNNKKSIEIRLGLRISLMDKDENLLKLIHKTIGGSLLKRFHAKSRSFSITYDTVSFKRMFIILKYLDKYSLQTKQYLRYIFVRKAYLLIQNSEHLKEDGLIKLRKYKKMLNNI